MPLLVTGLSHHTAPLEIRERVAFAREEYAATVAELCALEGVEEAVLVSTCNRSEIYGVVAPASERVLHDWLAARGRLGAEEAAKCLYLKPDEAAVEHLFRVACGLDSLVLGEPQILGQLKQAWQAAVTAGGAGKWLDRLFQHAFSASKAVRSNTGINSHPVSVASITAVLARQIFGALEDKRVLLVGAGEMVALCGDYFHQAGVRQLMIANRSPARAQELATPWKAEAFGLDALPSRLAEADIVVTSTASKTAIIGLPQVEQAIHARRKQPMFLVDLAVPRDIDPEVGKLGDAYLYTIDDLRQVADKNRSQRELAAEDAQATIVTARVEFMRWLHGARAAGSLKRLRAAAERSAGELAQRAVHQVQAGGDPEGVIGQLASTLTHRILHTPSKRLRQAAEEQHDDILKAADWLFDASDGGQDDGETQ